MGRGAICGWVQGRKRGVRSRFTGENGIGHLHREKMATGRLAFPGPYFGQSEDWPLDLNAPAVFFGALESALHFVVEHVVEDGAGDGFLAGFGDVGGADACV